MLTISGQRESTTSTKATEGFHQLERSAGKFRRQFQLPESADTSAVTARAEDGVLTIELQKLMPDAKSMNEISIA